MKIIILSGLSGSGKSTAIKALEDIGYYCVDNLPVLFIPDFVELCKNSDLKLKNIALVIDIRINEPSALRDINVFLKELEKQANDIQLVFLDAKNEILIKRFKETRRTHPLSKDGNIIDSVNEERNILSNIREMSDHLIDTSEYNVHELKRHIQDVFREDGTDTIYLSLMSFGFKHGYPLDADIVLDARFLPNPYFVDSLRQLNGNDEKIIEYVLTNDESKIFVEKITDLLSFLMPRYKKEGKSYLNMAIGCTGGKHRSVVITNEIANNYKDYKVSVKHRDIEK